MRPYALVFLMPLLLAPAGMADPIPACRVVPGLDHLDCTDVPSPPPGDYGVHPLDPDHRAAMTGKSWHPGCPVSLDDLSLVVVPYVDPKGEAHRGEIVVAKNLAPSIEWIFEHLFASGFPIESMQPVEAFDGDDDRSMAANNTSGFNCRPGPHPGIWSRHAFGGAVDVNPLWNPQITDGVVKPPAGSDWLDRNDVRPGVATPNGMLVKLFQVEGWHWGGRWPRPRDYQHFSADGK